MKFHLHCSQCGAVGGVVYSDEPAAISDARDHNSKNGALHAVTVYRAIARTFHVEEIKTEAIE